MLKCKQCWFKKEKKEIDGFLGSDTIRAFFIVLSVVSGVSGNHCLKIYIAK